MGAVTLHAQMEDTPHNGGGIFVDQPVVLVLQVLPVAVDRVIGGGLASVSSGLICRTLFPAAIPQKPFIYDIPCVGEKDAGSKVWTYKHFWLFSYHMLRLYTN